MDIRTKRLQNKGMKLARGAFGKTMINSYLTITQSFLRGNLFPLISNTMILTLTARNQYVEILTVVYYSETRTNLECFKYRHIRTYNILVLLCNTYVLLL